jgi:hypothetical protein
MNLKLNEVGSLLQSFFESKTVEQKARETKFVQRVSKLTGLMFLKAMVFGCLEHPRASLNQLAQSCLDLGLEISVQSFDERINEHSVAFMESMFVEAMTFFRNKQPLPLAILQQFTAINLFDSSFISLPAALAAEYPGSGGNASPASLKVQLGFDFLHGDLIDLALRPGTEADQKYEAHLALMQPGSLNISDLGYFKLDHLQQVAQKEAYFLSRYLPKTALLKPQGQPIDLLPYLRAQPKAPFEIFVLLGQSPKHQIPCRLIVLPLPQQVADRRRQKAKENAKRLRKSWSKEYLALLDWVIFVTNVPQAMLCLEQIARLYRVRWQIELLFKLAKSYCGLRYLGQWRRDRILTELYARLIGLILTCFLISPIRMPCATQANRELSPVQVRKIFQRFVRTINLVLLNPDTLLPVLDEMFCHILQFGFKTKRKLKPNICHALHLAFALHSLSLPLDDQAYLHPLLA